jgi:tetraprenyl-beta-curcumene synthase
VRCAHRGPSLAPGVVHAEWTAPGRRLTIPFLAAARAYWCSVFPRAHREIGHWRGRALTIADPALRQIALHALAERSNMEGAAAFATFAPRRRRAPVVRAAVAFQSAYNYLDLLAEQPHARAVLNAATLHAALPAALRAEGEGAHGWYAHLPAGDDSGYLQAMVDACRQALARLPSHAAVAGMALAGAERVAAFQRFNCGERQGDPAALRSWALSNVQAGSGLSWWEVAASAGSSLGVYVALAEAARPQVQRDELAVLERLYFPWVGALHSLLDQLVDVQEDERTGQFNFTLCYDSPEHAARRVGLLADQAIARAAALRGRGEAVRHRLILTAMATMYLSRPESGAAHARPAREAVLRRLGLTGRFSLAVFKLSERLRRRERFALENQAQESPVVFAP